MKKFYLLIVSITAFSMLHAQNNIGIGTNTPNNYAKLDISSTDKGVLLPRMTTALRTALTASLGNTEQGLIVFDTDLQKFFYWDKNIGMTGNWNEVVQGSLSDGKIWIGNASNVATEQTISGDATINNSGVIDLSNDAIETSEINNNAVTGSKINIAGNITGSMMYYDGTDWVNIGPGTMGKILQANGPLSPTWVDANTTLTKKDIVTSTSGVTISNGTGQLVGSSDVSVDIYTNSMTLPGLVPAGIGNESMVWGTDDMGTPSWTYPEGYVKAQNGVHMAYSAPNATTARPYIELGGPLVRNTTITQGLFSYVQDASVSTYRVNSSNSTLPSNSLTYPFGTSKAGITDYSIGSDGSYVYTQSWNSKPLMINYNGNNTLLNTSGGNVGIGLFNPNYKLEIEGSFGYGNGVSGSYRSRTETRNDASQIATQSGFFETSTPTNYPSGAISWWHLIDVRHSNNTNNYALQIAGSFFDQDLWFRKTNNNGSQSWSKLLTSTSGWQTTGNSGTNASTNFIGTTDGIDFAIRTSNAERMRITAGGNVGIGIAIPTQKLDIQGGNARINNAFIGDVGHGAGWAGFTHSSQANTTGYTLLASNDGAYTFINKLNTGTGYIGFRVSNNDVAVINNSGNMGIGTTTPVVNARLQVVGGAIMPQVGNSNTSGIYFPSNPGGGGGDEAYIRYYVEAGENTKLVIANVNDADDDISFRTGNGYDRLNINGNGTINLGRSVLFDCYDCGATTAYDLTDGSGGNFGDLVIQGRVLSTNSNLHLSPPGGSRVVINSVYRGAGGGTGTTGLDIEDGGIRMRKNYMYFQRYAYTTSVNGVDNGYSYALGNWDFCALAHFGMKNNASSTDEDDDAQCAVYPNGAGAGEQTNYDYYFTEQYNTRRLWYLYMEAFEDTNGITCAASCMNFE